MSGLGAAVSVAPRASGSLQILNPTAGLQMSLGNSPSNRDRVARFESIKKTLQSVSDYKKKWDDYEKAVKEMPPKPLNQRNKRLHRCQLTPVSVRQVKAQVVPVGPERIQVKNDVLVLLPRRDRARRDQARLIPGGTQAPPDATENRRHRKTEPGPQQ